MHGRGEPIDKKIFEIVPCGEVSLLFKYPIGSKTRNVEKSEN